MTEFYTQRYESWIYPIKGMNIDWKFTYKYVWYLDKIYAANWACDPLEVDNCY